MQLTILRAVVKITIYSFIFNRDKDTYTTLNDIQTKL